MLWPNINANNCGIFACSFKSMIYLREKREQFSRDFTVSVNKVSKMLRMFRVRAIIAIKGRSTGLLLSTTKFVLI